mgnify:CR=1 FL=1
MRKKGLRVRVDEVNSNEHALYIRMNKNPHYNFEYFMNRPYAYNRDKGKCRLCGGYVEPNEARQGYAGYSQDKQYMVSVVSAVTSAVSVIVSLCIALFVK